MKIKLKPVVTGKKPEPISEKYKEAIRKHAEPRPYNPETDPVLREFRRKLNSYRYRSY
ncbi:MAG: hypothetical protein GX958_07010 [Desulfitobacterium sp.]|nr:hypothetical protein [Desulfitobacterium sp.]